jgi:hypothetical protein
VRWWRALRAWLRTDPAIDALIAANRAQPRRGMATPDWAAINRLGARNARAFASAQQRVWLRQVQ